MNIFGTSRSRMQHPIAACTRAQTITRTCPCATCIWLLHLVPTRAQDAHGCGRCCTFRAILQAIYVNTLTFSSNFCWFTCTFTTAVFSISPIFSCFSFSTWVLLSVDVLLTCLSYFLERESFFYRIKKIHPVLNTLEINQLQHSILHQTFSSVSGLQCSSCVPAPWPSCVPWWNY